MLINMRNALMAGKRLPYDAEVEYLESTGVEWIDTEVIFTDTHGYTLTYSIFDASTRVANAIIFGSRETTGNTRMVYGFNAGTGAMAGVGCGVYVGWNTLVIEAYTYPDALIGHWYTASVNIGSATANDGTGRSATLGTLSQQSRTSYLFAGNTSSGIVYSKARISNCKIYGNGVLVRDLIPVRFTNEQGVSEGAMYNRLGVGGMNPDGSARDDGLYRNRGTGAFLYGNDIQRSHAP